MATPPRFYGRSRINERQDAGAVAVTIAIAIAPALTYDVFYRAMPSVSVWPFFLPLLLASVSALVPTRMVVGEDGVQISWFGSRFIHYRDVATIEAAGKDAIMTLGSGIRVRLPIGPKAKPLERHTLRRNELIRTVRERLEQSRQFHHAPEIEHLVMRNGRDARTWVDDLRTLTTAPAAPFRSLALPPDALWRVLESPQAPPDARLGAAAALQMISPDATTHERIRRIAASSASPRVRVSIDAIGSWREGDASLANLLGRSGLEERDSDDCIAADGSVARTS